jgi:hypothetical protein
MREVKALLEEVKGCILSRKSKLKSQPDGQGYIKNELHLHWYGVTIIENVVSRLEAYTDHEQDANWSQAKKKLVDTLKAIQRNTEDL